VILCEGRFFGDSLGLGSMLAEKRPSIVIIAINAELGHESCRKRRKKMIRGTPDSLSRGVAAGLAPLRVPANSAKKLKGSNPTL
jgi:hypothetical protein